MTVTCGHSDVLKIAYESRWQKYWACQDCGELFIPATQVKSLLAEAREAYASHADLIDQVGGNAATVALAIRNGA